MKLVNGVPIASFSEFSNKLEVGAPAFSWSRTSRWTARATGSIRLPK